MYCKTYICLFFAAIYSCPIVAATIDLSEAPDFTSYQFGTGNITTVTGIRDRNITGNYVIGNGNTGGLLFNDSLSDSTYSAYPTATLNQSNFPGAISSTPYGPSFGSSLGIMRGVGSYKTATSGDQGYLYDAATGITTTLLPQELARGQTILNTLAHSNFGNQVVGNYDTQLSTGNGFIYNIASNSYSSIALSGSSIAGGEITSSPQTAITGTVSNTAYGVYNNLISGGYEGRYNGVVGNYAYIHNQSNGATYSFQAPTDTSSLVTHFEGITSAGKAGIYNMVADSINLSGQLVKSWVATVDLNTIDPITHQPKITWTEIQVNSNITSANSMYQGNVIGVYLDSSITKAYEANIGNQSITGINGSPTIYTPEVLNQGASLTTLSGLGGDVINNGTVSINTNTNGINSGSNCGYVDCDPTATKYGGVISNYGSVGVSGLSENNSAILMQGAFGTLVNYGTISATAGNFAISTDESSSGSLVVNGSNGIINGQVSMAAGQYARFENSGYLGISAAGAGATHSVSGAFVQTSTGTLGLRVSSTAVDQLDVNGTAKITGALNANVASGASINGLTHYTILNATDGLTGTFSSIQTNLSLVNGSISYDANNAYLGFQANYTSAATNQNQQAVASSLQTAFYSSPSTAGQSVLDKINPMSAPQAQAAFNTLSGEGLSAQQTANFSATNLVVDASRRQANYWLMDECQTGASSKKNKAASHNALPTACGSSDNRQFRSWMTGVGASNSLEGSSSVGSASVSTQTGGGVVGFDYEVSSHLLVGGMVGGTASNYNVSARSSTGTDSSGQVGLYSVAKWEKFYVNTIFNYGYFSGDTKRYVNGLASTAEQTGKTSSNAFTGRAEVGYRMDHPLVNVMPFVAMQATSLQMNSFKESNTNNLGLSVAGNTTMSEPGSLGVQFDRSFDINDKWSLYPLLRMAWVHEFQTDRSINASLQALPTSNWTVNGASAASNAANIGITVQAMSKHGVAVFASGNAEASSTTQSYMGELGVKWLF